MFDKEEEVVVWECVNGVVDILGFVVVDELNKEG